VFLREILCALSWRAKRQSRAVVNFFFYHEGHKGFSQRDTKGHYFFVFSLCSLCLRAFVPFLASQAAEPSGGEKNVFLPLRHKGSRKLRRSVTLITPSELTPERSRRESVTRGKTHHTTQNSGVQLPFHSLSNRILPTIWEIVD